MDRLNTCIDELSHLGITGETRHEYVCQYDSVKDLERVISKEYFSRVTKDLVGIAVIGLLDTKMIDTAMHLEKMNDTSSTLYASVTAITCILSAIGESYLIFDIAKNSFKAGKYYMKSLK